MPDYYIFRTTIHSGKDPVYQLGLDGVEDQESFLSLSALPIVVRLQLRIVLNSGAGAVAQQCFHLPVGQGADSCPAPHAGSRTVFKRGHPSIAGKLPPVVEGREVLSIDQKGYGCDKANADDRFGKLEVPQDLLILLQGGFHLFFDMGDLLLDELLLLLRKTDDELVINQVGGFLQIPNRILEAGAGLDQPVTEGHQIFQFKQAVRGKPKGFESVLVQAGELCDSLSVYPVALTPGQPHALFQFQWAKQRVGHTTLLKKAAQSKRVVPGVLHAYEAVTGVGSLLAQPRDQLPEAYNSVFKLIMYELARTFGLADCRVERGLRDVDTDKKLLIHHFGGLGEKSRTGYTEMLIPIISPKLNILNGNRSVKRREGLIPAIMLINRRPRSSPLTPSVLLALYFLKLKIISQI